MLWDSTGAEILRQKAHEKITRAIKVFKQTSLTLEESATEVQILTCSNDEKIKLWGLKLQNNLAELSFTLLQEH